MTEHRDLQTVAIARRSGYSGNSGDKFATY